MKNKPVYIPEELHKKLKIIAIGKGKPLSEMVSEILQGMISSKKILTKV